MNLEEEFSLSEVKNKDLVIGTISKVILIKYNDLWVKPIRAERNAGNWCVHIINRSLFL